MGDYVIHQGDCLDVLRRLADGSVDACVTDPPYELGFMGRAWDRSGVAFAPATWEAVARVLKPGAHLLAFGGTRTFHRLTCAIEDAGFEIRDCLMWLYGQGFPKSLNLHGAWQGWGTALKPAWEPIILARKPLDGTAAVNVACYGTGGLNIDGCRIPTAEGHSPAADRRATAQRTSNNPGHPGEYGCTLHNRITFETYTADHPGETLGRWPANVVLDTSAAALLDEQSGEHKSGGRHKAPGVVEHSQWQAWKGSTRPKTRGLTPFHMEPSDGGASRFFYCAKASRRERDAGLDDLPAQGVHRLGPGVGGGKDPSAPALNRNIHPTVKPVALMEWLVRLVTPPGGIILDPFLGSGTTGVATLNLGYGFIGIEHEAEYVAISERRLAAAVPR